MQEITEEVVVAELEICVLHTVKMITREEKKGYTIQLTTYFYCSTVDLAELPWWFMLAFSNCVLSPYTLGESTLTAAVLLEPSAPSWLGKSQVG